MENTATVAQSARKMLFNCCDVTFYRSIYKESIGLMPKFNLMARNHRQRALALSQINDHLEPLVQQHSQMLTSSNAPLQFEMDWRQKFNLALRAKDALLHAILESSVEGIIAVDKDRHVTHANQRFWQMWQVPDSIAVMGNVEPIRKHMLQFLNPADAETYPIRLKDIYDGNDVDTETLRCKDGRVLERYSCPLMIDQENQGRIWSFRDVTHRVRNEEALAGAKAAAEAASLAKSDFLATMSHEIRTPMNGVIGMMALLRETPLNEEQKKFVNIVEVSTNALLTITKDILDYSKVEAGKLELEEVSFDLRKAVDETIDMLAVQAHEKGLEFGCLIDTQIAAMIMGDPVRLRQILVNIVSNAIKFTEAGSVAVRIKMLETADNEIFAWFGVTDTGIGIPVERQDCLFQSFSQVDASTTRKYGGTGLGLAICKRLVEMMDGTIGVESQSGCGSTFWFTARFKSFESNEKLTVATDRRLQNMRTLVVGDYSFNQEIIVAYLKPWGGRIDVAASAPEALSLLHYSIRESAPIRVVIIDHMMPGMDGEDLAKTIKSDSKFGSLKMVLMTRPIPRSDSVRKLQCDFDGFLSRPVKRDDLLNALHRVWGINSLKGVVRDSKPFINRINCGEQSDLGCKILLAEDSTIMYKITANYLKRFNFVCEIAGNGEEVVSLFKQGDYKIILMDIQMPVLDGVEATQKIRRLESKRAGAPSVQHVPIIALTGNIMKGDREKYIAAGMDDYLAKPFSPKQLLNKIHYWTNERPLEGS